MIQGWGGGDKNLQHQAQSLHLRHLAQKRKVQSRREGNRCRRGEGWEERKSSYTRVGCRMREGGVVSEDEK